jgi:hypothetical protein
MAFYAGLGCQLIGFATVGMCLFSGIKNGDYGKFELFQLIFGSLIFYLGAFVKGKSGLRQ